MSHDPIQVLKFGSSVLRSSADLPLAVHEIYRHLRLGRRVIAVTSAIGPTTDHLLADAAAWGEEPEGAHVAALLATGEEAAAALLALACERAGIAVHRLDAEQAGLRTRGPLRDSLLVELNARRILRALGERRVLILPGFTGRSECGRTSLLGRGGSDLTALFIAQRLNARGCSLIKSVDGIYERDPEQGGPPPRRFAQLGWRELETLGGCIVQPKAARFAREHRLAFDVGRAGSAQLTRVGPCGARLEPARPAPPPLKVALCGLGTVGGGVLQHLLARPESFELCGVLVRDRARARGPELDGIPIWTRAAQLFASDCEVLVELIGGTDVAASLIEAALQRGLHVVSANKAALSQHLSDWEERARAAGCRLAYSASVGGSAPLLEQVEQQRRRRGIESLRGVLNGSTNFILDRIAAGDSAAGALAAAQALGYAEADPGLDLDGTDATQKLALLARAAWGPRLALHWGHQEGIASIDEQWVRAEARGGRVVRLVAEARHEAASIQAELRVESLVAGDGLALTRGAGNRLLLRGVDGHTRAIDGLGAGRWPTAEAVVADLLELRRCAEHELASGTSVGGRA